MIGTSKIDVLIDQKDKLYEKSLTFAKYEQPDLIIMREAIMAFEKIIKHHVNVKKQAEISEEDKKYLFSMMSIVGRNFGTTDPDWFCAAEAILNTLFATRARFAHEYSKLFLD